MLLIMQKIHVTMDHSHDPTVGEYVVEMAEKAYMYTYTIPDEECR
jgi:hypothetical protein